MAVENLQTVAAITVPVVGVVVWLIRLEGRVNLNHEITESLKADVRYIRDRIDRALNGE